MHLAPKQILINAHVNLRNDLVTAISKKLNEEIESLIMEAEPKVALIFLETARKGHKIDARQKSFLSMSPRFMRFKFGFGETKLSVLNRKDQIRSFEPSNAVTTAIHGVSGKTW